MSKEEEYTAEDLFRELEEAANEEDTTVWTTVDGVDFYKNHPEDKIWWLEDPQIIGRPCFTFDFKTFFYLYRDYPGNLTKEQKEIFDKENPFWAEYVNSPK